MKQMLLIAVLASLVSTTSVEAADRSALKFEDGATQPTRKRITTADRKATYRWTFDLDDGPTFRDAASGVIHKIPGYGRQNSRVPGRTLTDDATPAMHAIHLDGSGDGVSCGPTPKWNDPLRRTLAFYVRPDKGPQPGATLLHQSGPDGPAVDVAFGPRGDGSDLSVRLGSALWESRLSEPIRAETWTHIIVTFGNVGIRVYVDARPYTETPAHGKLAPVGDAPLLLGGAPGRPGFRGAIDDVRLHNLTHQGIYFVMPRYEIRVPHPERIERSAPQWYRGKALALRITWNRYLYGAEWRKPDAGKFFDGKEIAQMAVDAGACGVLMKMRAPNGFPAFPSELNPADARPERDYAGELVDALRAKGLWFAPNLSKSNIDAMARVMRVSKEDSYYALTKEICDRYKIEFYQFRYDGFWGQDETYDPADYNHQRVFELFRKEHPETLININRFSGHGAEDMADIETSRPSDQLHYWEQEDFDSLLPCREWDWAVEVETPMGDDWGSGGDLTALPAENLLNKISALSAMGITSVIGFGPDVTGRFNDRHHGVLRDIGMWLAPRKPYLDDARRLHNVVVEGYPGLWYVNKVKPGTAVSLLSGSRTPVRLPAKIVVGNVGGVEHVKLAPALTPLAFRRIEEESIEISLENVEQDPFNTIVLLY